MLHTLTLPLLTKELTEQSARWRTYALRSVYCLLLYGLTLWSFRQYLGSSALSLHASGSGQQLFSAVLRFQLAAIYVLVPSMMAGLITSEKERDTLGLLLITKLGPGTIVVEKFLSRVVPMILYLLSSVPLMAVAYSLGGLDSSTVQVAIVALIAAVLQIGSLSLFCSAWCRTTGQALLMTYLIWALLYVGNRFFFRFGLELWPTTAAMRFGPPTMGPSQFSTYSLLLPTSPWLLVQKGIELRDLVPLFAPTALWLVLARQVLWRRAFLRPRNLLLKVLQGIDGFFNRINQNRFTQGIVLINEHTRLPLDKPIAWRETAKRSLGTTRYLIRMLLLIETPLLFILIVPLIDAAAYQQPQHPARWVATAAVWWIAIFLIAAQGTALIAGERSRQTLDVLLSVPLPMREILDQKFAGVWRMIRTFWIPLATCYVVLVWWDSNVSSQYFQGQGLTSLVCSTAAALIYLPLLGWLALHVGMRCKSQVQAMALLLGFVLLVTVAPTWLLAWGAPANFPGPNWGEPLLPPWTFLTVALLVPGPNPPSMMVGWNVGNWWSRQSTDSLLIVRLFHFCGCWLLWKYLSWRAPHDLVRFTKRSESLSNVGAAEFLESS